jgi:hypothetical protein
VCAIFYDQVARERAHVAHCVEEQRRQAAAREARAAAVRAAQVAEQARKVKGAPGCFVRRAAATSMFLVDARLRAPS